MNELITKCVREEVCEAKQRDMSIVVLRTLVFGASNHDGTVHGSRDKSEINHSFKHVRHM